MTTKYRVDASKGVYEMEAADGSYMRYIITGDGYVMLPPELFGPPLLVAQCSHWDGMGVATDGERLFVDASWGMREFLNASPDKERADVVKELLRRINIITTGGDGTYHFGGGKEE